MLYYVVQGGYTLRDVDFVWLNRNRRAVKFFHIKATDENAAFLKFALPKIWGKCLKTKGAAKIVTAAFDTTLLMGRKGLSISPLNLVATQLRF